jgi:hypothetical protein
MPGNSDTCAAYPLLLISGFIVAWGCLSGRP